MAAPGGMATADEGDAPSGPEACVVDQIRQERAAGLEWSGSIQDELSTHASAMAERGELDHTGLSTRVAGLPAGWSGYGEASYAGPLTGTDVSGVEEWCGQAREAFWGSSPHRKVLEDPVYGFVSVGTHWDGEKLWVAVGVFSHPDYEPGPVSWPSSYADGLIGGWEGRFYDDDASLFEGDIERLVDAGVTHGCNPPLATRFCPTEPVTRGEMAAFLVRALDWQAPDRDSFVDDDGSVFEQDIEGLSSRGVTEGCNPPVGDRFCPDRAVTRGEMATFLARALGLDPVPGNRFSDISGSVHSGHINAVAEAGITSGCGDGTRYCPDSHLSRGQMAAFLVRGGLAD